MAKLGRRKGKSSHWEVWLSAVTLLGCHWSEATGYFESKTVKTIEQEMRSKFPGHRFMILVAGHLLGFDGFEAVDWTQGRRHQVKKVYHVADDKADLLPDKKRERPKRTSRLRDCIFIWDHPIRNEYRIMIRENGKIRWINTRYSLLDAEDSGHAAAMKRYIDFDGLAEPDDYEQD
jgi:hypothetical protein